jgi:outer membrane protein, heavy metal efflux system
MWKSALCQACLPLLVSIWAAGCAASGSSRMRDLDSSVTLPGPINCRESFPAENGKNITLASWQTPSGSAPFKAAPESFPATKELTADSLVEEVLARNPSLTEMEAAWQAASARYPQAVSLDDPMVAGTFGPGTISPDDRGVEFGSRLEISQKYPWPGKRQLRGQNAISAANAAADEVNDVRLQLVESAKGAFYDYYLAERGLEVNEEILDLLKRIREDAQSRYESSREKVSIQEVYQFNVEIGKEQQRRLELERKRQVAKARINTLMHLGPENPLPPPAKDLKVEGEKRPLAELRENGLARRPDLQAVRNRLAAEEANLELAYKEFYPDLEPFFMYDRFMGNTSGNRDLATMLGVRLNLPVRRARRNAAVEEAEARLAQRRAELAKLTDQANFQIDRAYQEAREGAASVRSYETQILKDAQANLEAARPAYKTGLIPASNLLEAERNLVDLKNHYFEAIADYFRRQAALERAVGEPTGPGSSAQSSAR